jgi:hypothetical protein
MIDKTVVDKMEDGKDKQLMQILADQGKPYVKTHDGYAVKMNEEKQITYTDWNNQELTLTIPKDSYLMVGEDSSCPVIATEKEFNDANKFVDDDSKQSTGKGATIKIGLDAL